MHAVRISVDIQTEHAITQKIVRTPPHIPPNTPTPTTFDEPATPRIEPSNDDKHNTNVLILQHTCTSCNIRLRKT